MKSRKSLKLQICTQCQIAYAIVQSTKAPLFGPHGIIADMSQANLAYALHWIRDNHMREPGHKRIEIYSKSQTLPSHKYIHTQTVAQKLRFDGLLSKYLRALLALSDRRNGPQ